MDFCKVLISSIGLPTDRIGSWTVRIQKFQNNTEYFDYILSPTDQPTSVFIHCKKKQPSKVFRILKKNQLLKFQSKEFTDQLLKLSTLGKPLQILVIDDKNLLEGIVAIKSKLPKGSEIIYSHHGHRLSLPSWLMDQVDRVFFLSQKGYMDTFELSHQFAPISFIVGNGVDSEKFYPLTESEKSEMKVELGFAPEDKILLWMANSRPVKGLHLFKKIVPLLLEKYPDLKILSIGHEPISDLEIENWKQVGRKSHSELPKYLQIGSYYFFTSLWQEGFGLSLAEAVKCGNLALASKAGGIPELKGNSERIILVDTPNIIGAWINSFDILVDKENAISTNHTELKKELDTWNDYKTWELNYLKALQA